MLESTEIRWFFEGALPLEIKKNFEKNKSENSIENRIDYYLAVKDIDYVGIKLRNSRLEIKWRRKIYQFNFLQSELEGNIESWTRWEWNDKASFIEIESILEKNESNPWVKVIKKRMQRKFNIYKDKIITISPGELHADFAMEITELTANSQTWWSFSLDSLTGKDILYFNEIVENQLTDHSHMNLKKEWSYGYPHWLGQVLK
jgi:hypothetical protein